MASKGIINKMTRVQQLVKKDSKERYLLRSIIRNPKVSYAEKFKASLKLSAMNLNGCPCRDIKFCSISGKTGGLSFGIGNHHAYRLIEKGYIPGVVRV